MGTIAATVCNLIKPRSNSSHRSETVAMMREVPRSVADSAAELCLHERLSAAEEKRTILMLQKRRASPTTYKQSIFHP